MFLFVCFSLKMIFIDFPIFGMSNYYSTWLTAATPELTRERRLLSLSSSSPRSVRRPFFFFALQACHVAKLTTSTGVAGVWRAKDTKFIQSLLALLEKRAQYLSCLLKYAEIKLLKAICLHAVV